LEQRDLPVYYHLADAEAEFFVDDRQRVSLPEIGDGVLAPADGTPRCRVVDRWLSFDHHGRFNDGWHVFLERIEDTDDDRLGRLAPDYFGGG